MALNLDIVCLSGVVDMYGPADQSCSYSLSGHVSISLRPTSGLFGRYPAPARILLKSLDLTFEGQSELYTQSTGYMAARLCTVTESLIKPSRPVELCADDLEDGATWNVTFDLRIPGWLPPTDVFGDCSVAPPGTAYALHCTAAAISLDDRSGPASWMSLCTPSFVRTRRVSAPPCPVTLNRYAAAGSDPLPHTNYTIRANLPAEARTVPRDVLNKLEIVISVPEQIRLDQEEIPFVARMRAPGLSDEDAARLRFESIMVTKLDQLETYRTELSGWADRYPLPPASRQPPHCDLRLPHPMRAMFDVGLCPTRRDFKLCDTFSLLPESKLIRFKLDRCAADIPHGAIPPRAGAPDGASVSWYAVHTSIPLARASAEPAPWAGAHTLRADTSGPWLTVRHQLTVNICVGWTADGADEAAVERLAFTLPLEVIRTRAAAPAAAAPVRDLAAHKTTAAMPPLLAYDLPVYNQIYHSNGERKVDHSEQLPLYTAFDPEQSHAEDCAQTARKTSAGDDSYFA